MAYRRLALWVAFVVGVSGAWGCAEPTSLLLEIEGDPLLTKIVLEVSLSTGRQLGVTLPLGGKPLPGRVIVELPDIVQLVTANVRGEGPGITNMASATVTSRLHRQVKVPINLGVPEGADFGVGDGGPGSNWDALPGDFPIPDLPFFPCPACVDLSGADSSGTDSKVDGMKDMGPGSPLDLPSVPSLVVLAGEYGGTGSHDDVGTDARFEAPEGAVVVGNTLYVVEHWTGRLRTVDLTTRQTGTPPLIRASDGQSTTLVNPNGLAYDGVGFLYTSSWDDHTISKIEIATGKVSLVIGKSGNKGSDDGDASVARFFNPLGLAFDNSGVLWVADSGNKKLRRVDLAGPSVSTAQLNDFSSFDMGAPTVFVEPRGLKSEGGWIYVSDGGGVVRVDPMNNLVARLVAGNALEKATGIAISGDFLYVVDIDKNALWKYSASPPATGSPPTGTLVAGSNLYPKESIDGPGSVARFDSPEHLVRGANNDLLVVEYCAIRRFAIDTLAVTTFAGLADHQGQKDSPKALLHGPGGMVYDGADIIYFSDYEGNRIRKYTISTAAVTTIAGTGYPDHLDGPAQSAQFNGPSGLALDKIGNLYVAEDLGHDIRKITNSGMVTTIAGKPGMSGLAGAGGMIGLESYFDAPNGLAYDGDSLLFTAEVGNSAIRSIDLTTASHNVTLIAGSGAGIRDHWDDPNGLQARFDGAFGLAFDAPRKFLYVAEYGADTVRKVDLSNANHGVTTVSGIPYGPFANGISPGGGTLAGGTRHRGPTHLALDSSGLLLFVANRDGETIQMLDLMGDVASTIVGDPMQGFVRLGNLPARTHAPFGLAVTPLGLVHSSGENVLLLATGIPQLL